MSFRPTLPRLGGKRSPSSRQWLQRQFRDPYVVGRYNNATKFRSRSAFKLLELEQNYHFLYHRDVRCIVDLGAAPGGWSQVLAHKMGWLEEDIVGTKQQKSMHPTHSPFGIRDSPTSTSKTTLWSDDSSVDPNRDNDEQASDSTAEPAAPRKLRGLSTIIALDLLRIDPIPGVTTLQMDFLSPAADPKITSLVELAHPGSGGKVDIVLSDMAANSSGHADHDIEASLDISHAVLSFCKRHLRTAEETGRKRGGVLVLKYFMCNDTWKFANEHLRKLFNHVFQAKPPASRAESSENYWVCMGFKGDKNSG